MLILAAMLLMGLLAAIWGFLMCFMPRRLDRLIRIPGFTNSGFAIDPSLKLPIRFVMRLGNCVAGLVICAAGCWFTYMAASEIYRVVNGQAVPRAMARMVASLPNSPSPILITFSIFMIAVGLLIAAFPGRAMMVLNYGRSGRLPATPIMKLFLRFFGVVLALMASMSLHH